jgi:hypothetical protein
MLARVSRVIFEIILTYFIVYEAYFVVGEFCKTTRAVNVYFVVYALFSYL